ncbi:hypothetical protein [Microvirga puerhi]|uniref:Methyltransferase n=1 Tax=Microvirga puerhi TaxID=2876078 RepID=A0ABS7VTK1_9HYPH|nr:hypothetical protein [Microvirga puerhi]MBZ6078898.1 hypothetical protein [Microvirga puerhi]
MNSRISSLNDLDDFPTPPWGTRSLFEHVLSLEARDEIRKGLVHEPSCGRCIMSDVLAEYAGEVVCSDIANYGFGAIQADYLTMPSLPQRPSWVIFNPPFKSALQFTLKALEEAESGVAVLARSNWKEGQKRYKRLFRDCPPTLVAQFVERLPMVRGRWNPNAETATSYSWFVWEKSRFSDRSVSESNTYSGSSKAIWIPPGQRQALTRPDDITRFAWRIAPPAASGPVIETDQLGFDTIWLGCGNVPTIAHIPTAGM